MRGGDVGHAAAEPQPTGQSKHQRAVHRQRPKIQRDTPGLGQSAQLRNAQPHGRNNLAVGFIQRRPDVQAVAAPGLLQRMAIAQGDDLVGRERPAGKQFARAVHFRSRRMVHHDQVRPVEIKHLAQFLGHLQDIFLVARL